MTHQPHIQVGKDKEEGEEVSSVCNLFAAEPFSDVTVSLIMHTFDRLLHAYFSMLVCERTVNSFHGNTSAARSHSIVTFNAHCSGNLTPRLLMLT